MIAGKGKHFVLTEKGYGETPDRIKSTRKVGEPIKNHEEWVPNLWLEKGYVKEVDQLN